MKSPVLLFIYGSLKDGQYNNPVMHKLHATKLCNASTVKSHPLFMQREPYPWLQETPGTGLQIKGELWAVEEAMLPHFDRFEGVPNLYYRGTIEVNTPTGVVTANTYFRAKARKLSVKQLETVTFMSDYQGPKL